MKYQSQKWHLQIQQADVWEFDLKTREKNNQLIIRMIVAQFSVNRIPAQEVKIVGFERMRPVMTTSNWVCEERERARSQVADLQL